METVRIAEIDGWIGPADVKKPISRAVGADEIVRFAPGEFQRGTNHGSERAIVLAIGAPQDGGETTILRDCPECGKRTGQEIERPTDDADALLTVCVICGTETGRFT